MKAWDHFCTITHHRHLVRHYCFMAGLYWQGLTHDLSKYTWPEFRVGAKYYQGTRSPNNAEREAIGYSTAWLHHKGRNKHHLEYWIDYGIGENKGMVGMRMPVRYVVEMFCDRIAACRTYNKEAYTDANAYQYYEKGKSYHMLHERTRALLEDLLWRLKEDGEEKTFRYIREVVLTPAFIEKYEDEVITGKTGEGL